ncbi:MAG: OmpA family protein, partial [Archangium sp.]|nr:OmpA family protein [Archangium sp.]
MTMSLRIALLAALGSSSLVVAQAAQPLPAIQLERFHLNEGSRRGLTTATGDLLPRFGFRPSVALHYENNPLVYLRGDQRVGAVVSDRLTVHLAAVFGITSWLQVHGELPIIAWQRGDDLTDAARITPPTTTGVGSPRLGARLGILSQREGGLASNVGVDLAFQLATVLPFGTPGTLGTEGGFTLLPQL